MSSSSPCTPVVFEALVREHQAGLRAYVRALGAQDAWVDDLAQEAFLVAYWQYDRFEPGSDFGCWLRGIARHLVQNERRKTARRSRLLQEPLLEVLQEAATATSASVVAPGLMQALAECVAALPVRSRTLLERRYADDADAVTLARTFRSSAAAVRQTLARTRAVVRRCVGGKLREAWL